MNINKAEFIKSAAEPKDFISDGRPQLVFAGRSNVGKSSVINKLLNRRNFARVGSAPGKTAYVNYFLIDGSFYIVDLPGYGYAKVSQSEKERWGNLMENYFSAAGLITAGILIVDARHRPTEDDEMMAQWFKDSDCAVTVVANKVDKLKKNEIAANIKAIKETLKIKEDTAVIPFSAETGAGRDDVLNIIESYIR